MGRAPCCDKASVKKGPWSPEEDAKLKAYMEEHGTGGNWIALPHKIGLKRCGKSCRLRWLNYLRPNIKHGGFSEEEDRIICSLYISIGSRWSIIAAQLPGRTDNDIKNYWNTKLKKKLLGRYRQSPQSCRIPSSSQEPGEASINGQDQNNSSQNLSASALERLQLHMQLRGLHHPLSFYGNPLLRPNLHPLEHKILQSQYNDAVAEIPAQQAAASSSMNGDINEDADGYSRFGDLSKDMDQNLNRMESELHDLLNGAEGEGRKASESGCFGELDGARESTNWWDTDAHEERLPLSSWGSSPILQPDSILQEYVSLYDL